MELFVKLTSNNIHFIQKRGVNNKYRKNQSFKGGQIFKR